MDEGLKRRLIGATVLVSLIVIFLPMLLEDEPVVDTALEDSNIPPRPESNFSSRVLPLESDSLSTLPEPDDEPLTNDAQVEGMSAEGEAAAFEPTVSPDPMPTAKSEPEAASPAEPVAPAVAEAPQAEPAKQDAMKSEPKLPDGVSGWVVQVGSFSKRPNADKVTAELKEKQFSAFVEEKEVKGKTYYRVLVGPETDRAKAEALWEKVKPELQKWKLVSRLRSYP